MARKQSSKNEQNGRNGSKQEADNETLTAACFLLCILCLLRAQRPSICLNLPFSRMKATSDLAPVCKTHDAASRPCHPGIWTWLDCRDPGTWFSGSATDVKTVNWRLHHCGKFIASRVTAEAPMQRSAMLSNLTALIRLSQCFKCVWHKPDELVESSCFETSAKAGTAML